jgi:parallel beta-helix repeat protein
MGRRSSLGGSSVRLMIGICALGVGFLVVGVAKAAATPVSCGAVITTNTKLQSDLVDCPGDGIVIGSDNIKLDLGGHRVDGLGSAAPFGSNGIDNSGGYDNVIIKDGTVTEFQQGVVLVGTTGNLVRGLNVSRNTSDAFFVDGFAGLDSNANNLVDNRAFGNGGGIHLRGSNGNVIRGNSSTANRGRGIELTFSSQSNSIDENVLVGNEGQGIFLLDGADGNELARNFVVANSLSGVLIAGSNRNEVVANKIAQNGGDGLGVVDGDFPAASDENVLARNALIANGADGIFVYGPSEFLGQQIPGAAGTVILANEADANADDGIDVRGAATTIARNSANRNVDLGIDAVIGVTDGGGNRAAGNGNPLQCVNVVCS